MRQIPLALATAILSGCALTGGDQLPVCDGRHPRPANPNGSVLTPTALEAPRATDGEPAPSRASIGSPAVRRCR